MHLLKQLSIGFFALALTSCGNLNSIHHQSLVDYSTTQVITTDAKQRHLIAARKETQTVDTDKKTTTTTVSHIICAEPSPDAFSVYSAAVAADASKANELQAGLRIATGETGATIGLRTESIQLLRDAMYRLCEAYAAGALTKQQYAELLQKYQKSMVTLIAIAQLTNAVRPPQVVISNQAQLQATSDLLAAKNKLDDASAELDKQTTELASLNKELKDSETKLGKAYKEACPNGTAVEPATQADCEKHNKLLTKQTDTIAKRSSAEKNQKEWQKVVDGEQAKLLLSNTSSSTVTPIVVTPIDPKALIHIANVVSNMTDAVFTDDSVQACLGILRQPADQQQLFVEELEKQNVSLEQVKQLCGSILFGPISNLVQANKTNGN
ncbi:MAG TPA: hypothetical protein DCS87_01105 [Rheinheimera sp.]|nr:hypothetical protein [Rheinheimera sp.]